MFSLVQPANKEVLKVGEAQKFV